MYDANPVCHPHSHHHVCAGGGRILRNDVPRFNAGAAHV